MSFGFSDKIKRILGFQDKPMEDVESGYMAGATYENTSKAIKPTWLEGADTPKQESRVAHPHSDALNEVRSRNAAYGVDNSTDAGRGSSGATIRGQRERKGF